MFNPTATRYVHTSLSKSYELNEREKKRSYNDRVLQIEHGSFTPLVMACTGGMGRECRKFYDRLAHMISDKRGTDYNITVTWIRRKIVFSLIKSICVCVRGSRGLWNDKELINSIKNDIATSETRSS